MFKVNRIILLSVFFLTHAPFCFASQNKITVTSEGKYEYIKSNGIPDHAYGTFPNRGNPHRVSEQSYSYRIPLEPKIASATTAVERINFGIAVNGVPFDPGTAEYWQNDRSSGWRYEALSGHLNLGLDQNNAHVQPSGAYHYHGIPNGLVTNRSASKHSEIVGYAADGFPIYAVYGYRVPDDTNAGIKEMKSSYLVKRGVRPSGPRGVYDGRFVQDYEYQKGLGDLDECNGRFGITPDYPDGTYHYFLTEDFPFVPRCFRGTPDPSFNHKRREHAGPPGGRGGRGAQHGSPRGHRHPDLSRAAQILGISHDQLRQALGPPPPNLSNAARKLRISESKLKRALDQAK